MFLILLFNTFFTCVSGSTTCIATCIKTYQASYLCCQPWLRSSLPHSHLSSLCFHILFRLLPLDLITSWQNQPHSLYMKIYSSMKIHFITETFYGISLDCSFSYCGFKWPLTVCSYLKYDSHEQLTHWLCVAREKCRSFPCRLWVGQQCTSLTPPPTSRRGRHISAWFLDSRRGGNKCTLRGGKSADQNRPQICRPLSKTADWAAKRTGKLLAWCSV